MSLMNNIEMGASKAWETILDSVSLAKAAGPRTWQEPTVFFRVK